MKKHGASAKGFILIATVIMLFALSTIVLAQLALQQVTARNLEQSRIELQALYDHDSQQAKIESQKLLH